MPRIAVVLMALLIAPPAVAADQQPESWQFGGFADLAYVFDGNDPENHQTRSRGTAFRVNELSLNIAGVSARKTSRASSRWGAELAVHAGSDSEVFGFSPTAPRLPGSLWLRHVGRANASYLIPRGTIIQAGIFGSPIGYDSLYAKDNLNYTRPWTADFTPYLMLGVNASHTFDNQLTASGYVVNGFWHLAAANRVPTTAVQLAYPLTPQLTVKHTLLSGPHQDHTALRYWRVLADTIIERRGRHWIAAFNVQAATEQPASPERRGWWLAAQAPVRWQAGGPWRIAVRPEVAWDSDGRWTGFEQTVTAVTATIVYRVRLPRGSASITGEYRTDTSTGPGGGFYTRDADRLTAAQRLFILAVVVAIE